MFFPGLPRHFHSVRLLLFFLREDTRVDYSCILTLLLKVVYPVADFHLLFIQTVSASDAHVLVDVFVYPIDFNFLDLFATFWTISLVQLNVGIQTLLIKDLVAIITLHCRSDINETYADATDKILRNTLVLFENIFH